MTKRSAEIVDFRTIINKDPQENVEETLDTILPTSKPAVGKYDETNDPIPSTSKAAVENTEFEFTQSMPKKSRTSYNFWSGNETENSLNVDEQSITISDLKLGKLFGKSLKFRVIYISEIRVNRKGKAIDFHGMDKSGEISFINFGQNCAKIYKILKVNSIFSLVDFYVNEENVDYPSGCKNKLQIYLTNSSAFEEILEEENFPQISFNFTSLNDIQNINNNEVVDVIGVFVKNFGLGKNWKGTPMRELALTDEKKENLIITLWSNAAQNFIAEIFSVLIIKRAVVTEHAGEKKLNCISGTLVWVCPDIEEACTKHQLFQEAIAGHKH